MEDSAIYISSLNGQDMTYYMSNFDHSEYHKGASGEYLKIIVFGGLDGIVTIFAIISGCIGASIDPIKIIFIGLGNLFADGLSMGLGEFASHKAEMDYIDSEMKRETWEIEYFPEEEKNEMYNIYTTRYGFSDEDAKSLVNLTFKNKRFFLEHMMVEELGLIANGDDKSSPVKRALIMFLSFMIFGIIPLVGFSLSILVPHTDYLKTIQSLTTGLSSITSLSVLGYFKV